MKLNTILKNSLGVVAFCSMVTVSSLSHAIGGLMVSPNRVELDGKTKSREVKLVNRSDEAVTYRVSFQNLRMKEDGTYEEITKDQKGEEKFAEDLIKFSPRRITLKAGEVQTIRLLAKIPSDAGEYRSHLLFKEEAPEDFGNSVEKKTTPGKKVSVVLRPVFAISIPVIVRSGDLPVNLAIDNMEVKADPKSKGKVVALSLKRSGEASTYGSVVLTYAAKGSKEAKEIASLGNVAVYYPYAERDLNVPLDTKKSKLSSGGVIEAKFYAFDEENAPTNRGKVLAQKTLTVN